jgi:hypothetical protein
MSEIKKITDNCIESNTRKGDLKLILEMDHTFFSKMTYFTDSFPKIKGAINTVMLMTAKDRTEWYASLSTNMEHQNSTEENLILQVLIYLYQK